MPQSVIDLQTTSSAPFVLIPKVVSGLGVLISGLVLLGWTFNLPVLQSILPGQPQMVPLTAIAFILTSVSLGTLQNKRGLAVVSGICALAVILIAVLIISEYISRFDFGFDKLLFSRQLTDTDQSFPGRPSPHTALALLLIGSALLLSQRLGRAYRTAQGLAVMAALIASMALVGYIYDIAFL